MHDLFWLGDGLVKSGWWVAAALFVVLVFRDLAKATSRGRSGGSATNYAQSFRVGEVEQRNSQAVTAMSPIQLQKQIRLQEARLLLATHPHDITRVGSRVGYESPSQFSRE